MAWIATVSYEAADARLRSLYDRVAGPDKNVDNIMMMHGLRPHTMQGHMALYKSVLHHSANTLPPWYLETVGIWVSALNRCDYCVEHHFAGLQRLLRDDSRCMAIRAAIMAGDLSAAPLSHAERCGLRYAQALTEAPWDLEASAVRGLREVGFTDGEILEINQVAAYFNYANRTVLGLGCSTAGDILGLSPQDTRDPDNWGHR